MTSIMTPVAHVLPGSTGASHWPAAHAAPQVSVLQLLQCFPGRQGAAGSARWAFHDWACSQALDWWQRLFALLQQEASSSSRAPGRSAGTYAGASGSAAAAAAAGFASPALVLALQKPIWQLQATTHDLAATCTWLRQQGPTAGHSAAGPRTFLPLAAITQQQHEPGSTCQDPQPAAQAAVVLAAEGCPLPCWRPDIAAVLVPGSSSERELLQARVAVAPYSQAYLLQALLALHLQHSPSSSGPRAATMDLNLLWCDLAAVRSLPEQLVVQVARDMLPQGAAVDQALLVPALLHGQMVPVRASEARLGTAMSLRLPLLQQAAASTPTAAGDQQLALFSVPDDVLLASSGAGSGHGNGPAAAAGAGGCVAAGLQGELLLWEAFFVALRMMGRGGSQAAAQPAVIWPALPLHAAQHAAGVGQQLLPAFTQLGPQRAAAGEAVVRQRGRQWCSSCRRRCTPWCWPHTYQARTTWARSSRQATLQLQAAQPQPAAAAIRPPPLLLCARRTRRRCLAPRRPSRWRCLATAAAWLGSCRCTQS
jgi:hypothetical protein